MHHDHILSPQSESVTLSATAAGTTRVDLLATSSITRGPLLVYNPTAAIVRVRVGGSDVTATGKCFPVQPGETRAFNPRGCTHIAAWCAVDVSVELFALGGI